MDAKLQRFECAAVSTPCSSRQHGITALLPLSSTFTLLFLTISTLLASSVLPAMAATVAPSHCFEPPPPLNCRESFYYGDYFYHNASSNPPCLRFPHWGCEGDNAFPTAEECMQVCQPGDPSPPSPSPSTSRSPSPSLSPFPSPSPSSTTDDVTSRPPPTTLSPSEICQLPIRNFFCVAAVMEHLWVYDKDSQSCETIVYFNCEPKPPNMFYSREDCIAACGPFSPNYPDQPPTHSLSPSLSHVTPSQPIPASTAVVATPNPKTATTHEVTLTSSQSSSDKTEILPEVSPTKAPTPPIEPETPPTSTTPIQIPPPPPPPPLSQSETPPIATIVVSPTQSVTTTQSSSDSSCSKVVRLTAFDVASIAVGVVVVLLIVILVTVVTLLVCRHRAMVKKQKLSPVMKVPVTSVKTEGGVVRTQPVGREFSHSYPTSSHYV